MGKNHAYLKKPIRKTTNFINFKNCIFLLMLYKMKTSSKHGLDCFGAVFPHFYLRYKS